MPSERAQDAQEFAPALPRPPLPGRVPTRHAPSQGREAPPNASVNGYRRHCPHRLAVMVSGRAFYSDDPCDEPIVRTTFARDPDDVSVIAETCRAGHTTFVVGLSRYRSHAASIGIP